MRDRVGSVFVVFVCLCLTVRSQAPLSQLRESGSQSPVPFTAEYKQTVVQTKADGKSVSSHQIEINSNDSHGRRLFASTQVSTGITNYTIDDPVAGMRVVWNTRNRKAKVLNYA